MVLGVTENSTNVCMYVAKQLKVLRTLCVLLMVVLISGCGETVQKKETLVYGAMLDSMNQHATITPETDDCVRGVPEPVLDTMIFPEAHFELLPDGRGIEKVVFGNGDSLTVINWGCEYYNLTFCFVTKDYQAASSDIKYWVAAGIALMKKVEKGVHSAIHVENDLKHVKNVMASKQEELPINVRFGVPIICDSSEIEESVTFEAIEVQENGYFKIGVTFSVGPL